MAKAPSTAFALQYIDIVEGAGAAAEPRRCYYTHYTGWLADGTKFSSSYDSTPGQPITPISFPHGARRVIAGWDGGFEGMRIGGKRRLIVPYQLGYGETGRPPNIPPRSTLIFDIEFLAMADTLAREAPSRPESRTGPTMAIPTCPPWNSVNSAR